MNKCDNGCGRGIGQYENPSYELRVVEPYTVSKVYKFCSVGCLSDWATLSSQGLKDIPWTNMPGFTYEFGEDKYAARNPDGNRY